MGRTRQTDPLCVRHWNVRKACYPDGPRWRLTSFYHDLYRQIVRQADHVAVSAEQGSLGTEVPNSLSSASNRLGCPCKVHSVSFICAYKTIDFTYSIQAKGWIFTTGYKQSYISPRCASLNGILIVSDESEKQSRPSIYLALSSCEFGQSRSWAAS